MTMPPVPTASGRPAALAVGGVLTVVLIMFAGFRILDWTSGATTRGTHHTYSEPIRRVTVEVDSGEVTVTRAAGTAVVVDDRLRGSIRTPNVEKRLSAGTLTLRGHCGAFWARCDISMTVAVPHGVAVDLTSHSGDVSATGVDAPVTLLTSSGNVQAGGIGGPLRMRTSSGDVTGAGLDTARVTAATSSGDVTLSFATPPRQVAGRTSSGDLTVVVPSGPQAYDVAAHTSSGDREVAVRTDPASSRSIEARTSSGDVTVTSR